MKSVKRKVLLFGLTILMSVSLVACGPKESTASYTAGTYTATAKGNNGDVTLEVTFDESAIKSIEIKEENIMELNKYIDQLIKGNQPSPCIFKKCNADTAAELLKILGISTNECISEKHDGNHKFQFYTNEKQIIRITVYCNGWIQVWVNDDPLYSLYM